MDWLLSLGLGIAVLLVLAAWYVLNWVGRKVIEPAEGALVVFISRRARALRRTPSEARPATRTAVSRPSNTPPPPPSA